MAITQSLRVKYLLKVRKAGFSGFHGNRFQFLWILVNRHPKGYVSWKFQVSSPDGRPVIMWPTDIVTERQAIYKLMMMKCIFIKKFLWPRKIEIWKKTLMKNQLTDYLQVECKGVYYRFLCSLPMTVLGYICYLFMISESGKYRIRII